MEAHYDYIFTRDPKDWAVWRAPNLEELRKIPFGTARGIRKSKANVSNCVWEATKVAPRRPPGDCFRVPGGCAGLEPLKLLPGGLLDVVFELLAA